MAEVPIRSILKLSDQKPVSTESDEQTAEAERNRRNLGVALYHANRIQSQKDIQADILSHIEALVDFPAGAFFTRLEAARFVTLIHPFQPSDFDSLVEERRIDGKCGYALCSHTPRSISLGASASWKLKHKGAGDYSSDDCMKKALYVKAQLSEYPAWERQAGQQPEIVLHKDDRLVVESTRPSSKEKVKQWLANGEDLALERGEDTTSLRPKQVMTDSIVEKRHPPQRSFASSTEQNLSHTAIEGYEPV